LFRSLLQRDQVCIVGVHVGPAAGPRVNSTSCWVNWLVSRRIERILISAIAWSARFRNEFEIAGELRQAGVARDAVLAAEPAALVVGTGWSSSWSILRLFAVHTRMSMPPPPRLSGSRLRRLNRRQIGIWNDELLRRVRLRAAAIVLSRERLIAQRELQAVIRVFNPACSSARSSCGCWLCKSVSVSGHRR